MKIGLDLDKTITEVPWMFSALTKGLIADGHEVHIITYRDTNIIDYTKKQLIELGIQYTELHLPPNKEISPEEWKASLVSRHGINVMFDDEVSILSNMSGVNTFLVSKPDDPYLGVYAKVKNIYEEFWKVDDMLGLTFGTISSVVKNHVLDNLSEVREALLSYNIQIDDHGFICKPSRDKWIKLMYDAGMDEMWLQYSGFSKELTEKALCEIR
jgi:hypothetical protein